MARTIGGRVANARRERLRKEHWPNEPIYWTGPGEQGFFCAPRTLPLIIKLLDSKSVSGNLALGGVYLDLLARHIGQGLVEMGPEDEHAYASGYESNRSIRSWRDRMAALEELGFIRTATKGGLRFGFVLLIHPAIAVLNLRALKKVPDAWWGSYRAMQIEYKEPLVEDLVEERMSPPADSTPVVPTTS
jgi:hypothetical protein